MQFRHLISFLLILAFAASTFSRVFVVADYYANTNAYIKKCENKTNLLLRCKGKCQMMKKLQEQEKKDQQNPERKIENKNDVFSSSSFYTGTINAPSANNKQEYALFNIGKPIDEVSYCFHPPGV